MTVIKGKLRVCSAYSNSKSLAMAAGGSYNAPSAEDTRAGFGKDTQMDGIVGGGNGGGGVGGGVTGTPLFGDYKK